MISLGASSVSCVNPVERTITYFPGLRWTGIEVSDPVEGESWSDGFAASAVSRTVARPFAAPFVGWHGQAQRGHVLGGLTHARASGLGMPPEKRKNLFSNGTSARSSRKGICKAAVYRQGGTGCGCLIGGEEDHGVADVPAAYANL